MEIIIFLYKTKKLVSFIRDKAFSKDDRNIFRLYQNGFSRKITPTFRLKMIHLLNLKR